MKQTTAQMACGNTTCVSRLKTVRLTVHQLYSILRLSLVWSAWLSGNIVGRINEVTLRRAGLVLRWVTVRR